MSEETHNQPNSEVPRRRSRNSESGSGRRSSGRHSRSSGSKHRRSSSSSSSSSKADNRNKFTLGQALLLLWSAGTLGSLLYLINDVHAAPLPAIAGLTVAAVLGLLFFFRGLRKKKRR